MWGAAVAHLSVVGAGRRRQLDVWGQAMCQRDSKHTRLSVNIAATSELQTVGAGICEELRRSTALCALAANSLTSQLISPALWAVLCYKTLSSPHGDRQLLLTHCGTCLRSLHRARERNITDSMQHVLLETFACSLLYFRLTLRHFHYHRQHQHRPTYTTRHQSQWQHSLSFKATRTHTPSLDAEY
jgi:hypothetical protein